VGLRHGPNVWRAAPVVGVGSPRGRSGGP
jgi:hypothetical protein